MIDKIIKTVSKVLGTEVNENSSQKNCDKWDSLQHLNIIVALEDTFDVSFEPEEIAEMKSIIMIEQVINSKNNPT